MKYCIQLQDLYYAQQFEFSILTCKKNWVGIVSHWIQIKCGSFNLLEINFRPLSKGIVKAE